MTAHPRAGGKNITAVWDGIVTVGSSPRGRGKHCEPVECSVIAGLIPARAGKTASMPLDSTVIGAHPRAGGENSRSSRTFVSWLGSSPRGRGKHQVWRCYEEHSRLIPARAGKTSLHDTSCAMYRAHPRAGGENRDFMAVNIVERGSSPRGRGKPDHAKNPRNRARLIPARAGKTGRHLSKIVSKKAHPRAGGENTAMQSLNGSIPGSSPRGRGKLEVWSEGSLRWRLIPARAGKTRRILLEVRPRQAHPRAGGENAPPLRRTLVPTGSSPRGRGKRMASLPRPAPSRLIPARAGKTKVSSVRASAAAHPRAGGENRKSGFPTASQYGSSPRGRGKRSAHRPQLALDRLIPARAGKTRE